MGYPPMGHPSQMSGQMPPQMQSQMQPQMQPPQPQMSQGPRTQNQMQPGSVQQSPTVISRGPRPANEGAGPSVTVFVGNITDRAPDNMMRQILQHCGSVVSWKRVQGASGVLQGTESLTNSFKKYWISKLKFVILL
jgi:RNA-binding protein 25